MIDGLREYTGDDDEDAQLSLNNGWHTIMSWIREKKEEKKNFLKGGEKDDRHHWSYSIQMNFFCRRHPAVCESFPIDGLAEILWE